MEICTSRYEESLRSCEEASRPQKTKEAGGYLVRTIIFIMTLREFNSHYSTLAKQQQFKLSHEMIIVSYQTSESETGIIEEPHGNSKKKEDTPVFRPVTHSSKKLLQQTVASSSSTAPRHILSNVEQNQSVIYDETNTALTIQQIYNYRKQLNREKENPDSYLELIRNLIDCEPSDPSYF